MRYLTAVEWGLADNESEPPPGWHAPSRDAWIVDLGDIRIETEDGGRVTRISVMRGASLVAEWFANSDQVGTIRPIWRDLEDGDLPIR